ncbi:hypothetical protein JK635_02235 [Neobacillus sp. YIM B02564]|uniref:Uncharacterized protein n=1 Tax=Neobacillus paridis TaxID=2803862 RepID=A0ABS1TKL0_9BACI|nr:hypothetical protein [Neobacillus paridis]MBL4951058.1 hypothetical protein [Neobacillus paridis]
MKQFEVNFIISGNYYIDANSEEDAREIVNEIINDRYSELEGILHTAIKDDDYVTDVIDISID